MVAFTGMRTPPENERFSSMLPPRLAFARRGGSREYQLVQDQAPAFQDSVRVLPLDTAP
jgi:hypothetical protein